MKKRLKGFTLMELIVVLATFSIIMFGAMQLIAPVSKMIIQAETQEQGTAAVSSISSYLDYTLSSSQFMLASNTVPEIRADGAYISGGSTNLVQEFGTYYCRGILKNGSTLAVPNYADARIRVLVIDNDYATREAEGFTPVSGKSLISVYEYTYDGGTGAIAQVSSNTDVINRAYLDTSIFQIRAGAYSNETDFNNAATADADMSTLVNSMNTRGVTMTIESSTYKGKTWYNYLTTSAMALVNINNSSSIDAYYEIGGNLVTGLSEIHLKTITSPMRYYYDSDPVTNGNGNGYCFVYCYGDDIDVT